MGQLFSEHGESPPLPYRHHRTDRSWTGMHEWGKLSGTLAAADAKMFERLALILLRLLCTRPEEPLDTTTWIPSQGGQLLLGERTPHPLFIQPLTFSEAPSNLGEPHVRQVRESVRRFLESPVEASCYLLVHNSELSSPTFREGVQAEIEKLRESGKVARAETWGRQRFLGEAFNAMTDRVLAAIRAGSLSMAPITAALDSEAGAPLAQVPLRASLLSIDQYRMRSMDDLGPRRIIDPVQVILEQDAGNLSLLLGGFGFGKTTAVGRALAEGHRQVLYVPGATISEEVKGAKDLLFRCINSDKLFGVCSEGEREIYDRIVRASVEYLFKDPGLPVTVIIDGLDESPFLNRKGGLQGLFNSLYQVGVPVVLAMRTEFWDKKREEFETIVGDVARHGSTRIQKVRAIELLPWEDLQILELVRRARNAWKDPEEACRLAELENLVQQGRFESIYGDIPRRPLFLKFVLESVAEAGLPGERIGRGALFQGWARRKILRDILNARKAGGGRPRLIADDESSESVLETSWEAMCWAASFMIEEQEGRLELLPDCSLDRVLAATPRLGKITEALPLYLQSLLLPAERKKGRTDRIAFAHRVFQEFFLAWHLLSERGADTGRTLPDSVLEWVRDLQKEQLVEPRAKGRSPGLPAAHATPFSQPQRGTEDWTPDLELLVMERLGNSKRIFDLHLTARDPRLGLNHHALPPLSFDVEPAEFFRRHLAEITDLSDFGRNLEDKSAFLSEKILPRELLKLLSSLQGQTSTLLVQSDDPWIPWELFRIGREPESDIADGPFLCEAFAMTRWLPKVGLKNVGLKIHLPFRRIAVVAPRDSGLPHAEEEWEGIAALARPGLRRVERIEPARPRYVQTAFKQAQADGWHFVAHGRSREGAPDLSVIELEEREQLTPEVLSAEGRNMGKPEPLVFLNACSSGQTGLSLIGLGGWAPRLLEVGAGAFIGTLWPIKDRRGMEFARAFYEAFTGGTPLGEAVRRARLAIRSEEDPTWLAYTAFAHPLAVCAPPGSPRPASVLKPVPTNAPPRPLLFVGRRRDLEILKQRLGAEGGPQVAHPLQVLTAVRGLPGVGKSTFATALSHDPDIHSAFPGGILWASLGEDPDLLSEVAAWGQILGSEDLEMAANLQEAVLCLRNLLRDRRTLLVLDDVWDPAQVQPVQSACGEGCALLLTTRQTGVAQSFHARPDSIYTLEVLDEPDALELLAALAPEVVETYPEECRKLVRNLEYLPLSLQVAGRMLHAESRMGWDLHNLIGELGGGGGLLRETAPPDRMDLDRGRIPTIDELLRRSTDRLDSETRERFRRLGGFAAKPATFGLEALRKVWGVEDPRPSVRILVDRGLLEPVGDSRFQMHSLLVQHAASLEA